MGISERRQKETESLKERVLDTAEQIFVHEGVQQVTMRRIAAEVEYAPTVLYRLFKDKADLLDHLIARGYKGVRDRYDRVRQQHHEEPGEYLESILAAYIDYALAHPNHYRMWFDTSDMRSDGQQLLMSHGRLTYVVFQVWLDGIDACRRAGQFGERDTHDIFQILWSRVHGLISVRLQHPGMDWAPVTNHLKEALRFL
jgi:AcrR family transcriptional regulator